MIINGTEYAIEQAKAKKGAQAFAILARYVKEVIPVLSSPEAKDAGNNNVALGIMIVGALAPLLERNEADDLFKVLALFSGIEQAVIEETSIPELAELIGEVVKVNNIAGLFSR